MLTKQDYRRYLEQMAVIEVKMIGIYADCAKRTEDSYLRDIFNRLTDDEKRHRDIVEQLKGLFAV